MLTLNLEQAQKLIGNLIEKHGEDKVYERPSESSTCLYVHDDGFGGMIPGCIVGHALVEYGVDIAEVARGDEFGDIHQIASRLADYEILDMTPDAVDYLYQVQFRQDDGQSWGEANQRALEALQMGDDE